MTDQNRTAETEQARDLVDTFQLEWDASYPGMHFKCVPSVTRLVRMGEYIARAVDETLAEFDLNRGEAEVLFALVRNPHIDIISHPGDGTALLNFEPIVLASKEYDTLLEINNSSLNPVRNKSAARRNNLEILRLCKKYEVPVILGSDAHISFDIARYDRLYDLLREAEFPEALVMNDKVEEFKARLKRV